MSDDNISDHDIDIDQKQLPGLVKEWMATKTEIESLTAEIREKRKRVHMVHQMIVKIMKGGGIGKLNISSAGAALTTRTKKTKGSMTKKYLITTLTDFFEGDAERAKDCAGFLENHRPVRSSVNLSLDSA